MEILDLKHGLEYAGISLVLAALFLLCSGLLRFIASGFCMSSAV